ASELMAILTGREREVMEQLVLGKSNKLIAHELGISPRTVEIHRARVQEKLKARDLSDLVRLARAPGPPHSKRPAAGPGTIDVWARRAPRRMLRIAPLAARKDLPWPQENPPSSLLSTMWNRCANPSP